VALVMLELEAGSLVGVFGKELVSEEMEEELSLFEEREEKTDESGESVLTEQAPRRLPSKKRKRACL
jgi:hypothetical protein